MLKEIANYNYGRRGWVINQQLELFKFRTPPILLKLRYMMCKYEI